MSKTLKEFLNQPAVQHVPTAEEVELAAILNAQPEGGLTREAVVTLPDDTFTREQAELVAAQFENVVIEEGDNTQFRLVVLHESGKYWRWREWNFAAGAGMRMNRSIGRFGVRKPQ